MSWEALAVAIGVLVGVGAALRGWSWWLRERVVRTIPPERIRRASRGVSLRVMVHAPHVLPGMNPARTNRTRGDLILTDDRFLLTSGRGTLIDLGPGVGRPLTAARCTGPGRLVLEGDRPGAQGQPGLFRVETMVPDAADWASALAPFVVPSSG